MFAPTTKVYILKDAPVDPLMNHFINFTDAAADANYFIGLRKKYWDTCHCEPVNGMEGSILLKGTPEDYYDCNYLMWQNSQFTTKWFYAYLSNVRPYASDVTIATYVIDYWHTWYYDMTLGTCFINREHVNDDTIGRWREDEPVSVLRYINPRQTDLLKKNKLDTDKYVCVYFTFTPNETTPDLTQLKIEDNEGGYYTIEGMKPYFTGGYFYNGEYQGAQFLAFKTSSATINEDCARINSFLEKLVASGTVQRVLAVVNVPGYIAKLATAIPVNTFEPIKESITGNARPATLDGYTPENNKLFTSQFTRGIITNGMGSSIDFNFEDFDGTPSFNLYAQLAQDSTARLVFKNYEGLEENLLMSIDLTGFPQSSFSYSEYMNTLYANRAQRGTAITWQSADAQACKTAAQYGMIGSAASVFKGAGGEAPEPDSGQMSFFNDKYANARRGLDTASQIGGSVSNASGAIANMYSNYYNMQTGVAKTEGAILAELSDGLRMPNATRGVANANITWAMSKMTFTQYDVVPCRYDAERIDKYLSMFGYNVKKVGKPHVSGRKYWNYLELVDPVINGSIPADAKTAIASILTKGVTIWHDPSVFLNYNLKNTITGGDPD